MTLRTRTLIASGVALVAIVQGITDAATLRAGMKRDAETACANDNRQCQIRSVACANFLHSSLPRFQAGIAQNCGRCARLCIVGL